MKRKMRLYDDDDGRVIAPMNVDGMPWYNKYEKKAKSQKTDDATKPIEPMGKRETFKLIMNLYIGMIPFLIFFIGLGALFIWFLTKIWT